MHITLFSVTITIIGLFFVITSSRKFFRRHKHQSLIKYATIVVIWITIPIFALFPSVPHDYSNKLGLGENLNTFIFTGFIVVFLILFRLLAIIERLERQITEIIRKEALKDLFKN